MRNHVGCFSARGLGRRMTGLWEVGKWVLGNSSQAAKPRRILISNKRLRHICWGGRIYNFAFSRILIPGEKDDSSWMTLHRGTEDIGVHQSCEKESSSEILKRDLA